MSSKEDDTSGKSGGKARTSKRPARTIDLEAEEVEAGESESEPAGGDGTDEAVSGAESGPGGGDGGETAASAAPGTDSEEPRPSGLPPRTPPPSRTRPSDVRSFVTHLAAGLVGGLIGVVGAGIGLDKLPFANFTGGAGAPQDTARIEQRLDQVASKQQELAKVIEDTPRSEVLAELESRIVSVEERPAPEPAVPEELGARIAKLEDTLKSLQQAGSSEDASGLEQSAALNARIDAVSADFRKTTAALGDDVVELRETLDALPAHTPAGESEAVKTLQARLGRLEEKVAALPDQPVSAIPAERSGAAALALAFETVQRAADRGEPFAAQLQALEKLAGPDVDVSELAANAGKGVPAEAALLARLPDVLREARAAATHSGDETFLDRLASNARSVVRVHRIGPQEGGSAAAVLSRMEARMKESDLAGAIAQAKELKGPALEAVRPWLAQAEARQNLDAALAAARAKLLASLGDNAPAGPVR